MASLKEIKGRINSVRNTQKITSAMRMVATAKLRRTQSRAAQTLNYAQELDGILARLQAMLRTRNLLPQQQERSQIRRVVLITISSNSGLCGAFNTNLYKAVQDRMRFYQKQEVELSLVPIGKKVAQSLKRDEVTAPEEWVELGEKFTTNPSADTQEPLVKLLTSLNEQYDRGEVDRVEIVAPHFKSMGTQTMEVKQIIPYQVKPIEDSSDREADYIVEPSPLELYHHLLPLLQRTEFLATLLDAATAEHAARMLAMQTADDNASDLLQELTLIYNKTRQQTITNELIDIMSGKG